jgi:hypothetical protein
MAHDGIVFLFDEAIIVFLISPPPGEGDALLATVAQQLSVDKFGAVVGVDSAQAKVSTVRPKSWSKVATD